MDTLKFTDSLASGKHAELAKFTGRWKGISRVWFGPDELADESEIEGTISAILGGRFLLHTYNGSFQEEPLEGLVIIGFDLNTGQYQSAWVDSFHMGTGIMFSRGSSTGKKIDVLGSYSSGGEEAQDWGWRTEMEFDDNEQLIITAYNITPDGISVKATEIIYQKT